MKLWTGPILAAAIGTAIAIAAVGCGTTSTTPASTQQQAINAAYASYVSLDQAILATDAAVKGGQLKGPSVQTAVNGLAAAKSALDIGVAALNAAVAAAPAASAASTGAAK